MVNRIRALAGEPPDDEVPYGDSVVVQGTFGCAYLTPEAALDLERQLDRAGPRDWVVFRDRAGSRARVRARAVRALCESTAAQRAADRRLDRARLREEQADRRPWEDEL